MTLPHDTMIPTELDKHYKVVVADTPEEIAFLVNVEIAKGWQPLGAVSVMPSKHTGSRWVFFQSLIASNPLRGDAADEFFYSDLELQDLKIFIDADV